MKNRLARLLMTAAVPATLTGCASRSEPDTVSPSPADTPRVYTPVGTEVPGEFVAASNEAFPGIDAGKTYEHAQWTCLILGNVDGDRAEALSLLQSETAQPAEEARTYLHLATEFVCPDVK